MRYVHPLLIACKAATSNRRVGEVATSMAPNACRGSKFLPGNYRIAIMRKLFFGAALAALIGTPVIAADLSVKAPPAPVYSWDGLYVGGNVGWLGIEGVSLSGAPGDPP